MKCSRVEYAALECSALHILRAMVYGDGTATVIRDSVRVRKNRASSAAIGLFDAIDLTTAG
jgi:type IV secretory pathway protease TraF